LKGLWVSVSGAVAQQQKIDTIANNIANVNTSGFKKDDVTFKEHLTVLEKGIEDIDLPRKDWSAKDFYHLQGQHQAKVSVDGSHTNFTQGQVTPTHNPLDLALVGPGFFEILTPEGTQLSRSGEATIDGEGFLTDKQGNFYLQPGAKPAEERKIKISLEDKTFNVDQSGQIKNSLGTLLGKFSLKEVINTNLLEKTGNGLFTTEEVNLSGSSNATVVLQGNIEQSNVNPIIEMSELIKANRQFETLQKAIKTYDSITGRGVNDIAKF
jgi:flagellar basal-body rod protein FlgF